MYHNKMATVSETENEFPSLGLSYKYNQI